jgi:hypothetical protein
MSYLTTVRTVRPAAGGVAEPLTAAGLRAVARSDGRLLVGPADRLTDDVADHISGHLDELYEATSRQASVARDRRERVRDPRPDLTSDAARWLELLTRAREIDGESGDGLYWSLLGCRCMSAELYVTASTWRIRPRKGCEADYLEVKPYLLKNVDLLTPLLRSLANEPTPETTP